jgi:hypothetical protein
MDAAERRREPRIRVAFQVLRSMPPLEGVAFLMDVSAAGARLEGTRARPPQGDGIQLTMRLPGRAAPLELTGAVTRHSGDGFCVEFGKPCAELAALVDEELPAAPEAQAPAAPARQAPAAPARPARGVSPYQEVAVDCCAATQWISGRVCMPPRRTLLDQLNQGEPFVRVVDALTPHGPDPVPFVALRADALDLVLPALGQEAIDSEGRVGNFARRPVRVLMPYAVIEGSLDVLERIRVSDHLLRCGDFVALRDCRMRLARNQQAPRDLSAVAILLVNLRRVLGVSDLAASPPPEDEA